MSVAIKVENLSKAYQIGQIGTGTISRDLERWWTTRVMGKEDPFLKLGETNDRTKKSESNVVWSLKDINLEIEQGDALGIIGRNGAGKSTLLKLLSRVTSPTTGSIKIKGRVASLLEVGTGFHPELTGRENIYLNGSILGMRKKEIDRKLDEIVDFSGVERYVDTPVKRYSSGMTVRLAFAVAAHLDSEILIVDEVLAVGDAEFQKKCLGKMDEVSLKEGRTVLFVSHNMASIETLCKKGVLLSNGRVELISNSIGEVINQYSAGNINHSVSTTIERHGIIIDDIYMTPNSRSVRLGDEIDIGFTVNNTNEAPSNIKFNLELKNDSFQPVYCIGNEFNDFPLVVSARDKIHVKIKINEVDLRPGSFNFYMHCQAQGIDRIFSDFVTQLAFDVEHSDYLESGGKLPSKSRHGVIIKKYAKKRIDRRQNTYFLEI